MKSLKQYGVLPWILAAIILGILCSLFFPAWAVRTFLTFNGIFSNSLGMFIPLLIIGLVAPAIADLGKGAGKLLLITVAIAYFSTVTVGLVSYFTCKLTFPHILGDSLGSLSGFDAAKSFEPFFTIEMPAFINVTTALVVAFVLGLGCSAIKGGAMKSVLDDFRDIIMMTIRNVIIPCLPVFIFGIFLKMGAEGQVASVMGMFVKVVIVIIALHIAVLVCQFLIAGAISGKRPLKSLVTMLPAYVTALGTQSSAATIHMPCSILKIVACSLAVSMSMGMPTDFGLFFQFILMLAITMVAAPGVPGGAIMAALGVIAGTLGFNADMQGFVIAIYIALDCFGTAGNVTGDGAVTMIIDKIKFKQA